MNNLNIVDYRSVDFLNNLLSEYPEEEDCPNCTDCKYFHNYCELGIVPCGVDYVICSKFEGSLECKI